MPNILVRNLSEETVAALKRRAATRGRSLQQEVRLSLERVARQVQLEDLDPVAAAREMRERLAASGRVFTDSTQLIREDRDSH